MEILVEYCVNDTFSVTTKSFKWHVSTDSAASVFQTGTVKHTLACETIDLLWALVTFQDADEAASIQEKAQEQADILSEVQGLDSRGLGTSLPLIYPLCDRLGNLENCVSGEERVSVIVTKLIQNLWLTLKRQVDKQKPTKSTRSSLNCSQRRSKRSVGLISL